MHNPSVGHVYDPTHTGKGRWFCMQCQQDCGHDDLPCPCCFDDIPAVTLNKDGSITRGYS